MQQSEISETMKRTEPREFNSFKLKDAMLKSIEIAGFKHASPIQELAIEPILGGKDVVGQAHTGTGKTAAFGIPAINNMHLKGGAEMLVITPTRELATQVSDELYKLGRQQSIRTVTVYGGRSYKRQIDLIERGAQIVVATPGRMLDLLKNGYLPNFAPTTVVLDEADEMLDMGFLDEINEIFTYLPTNRQTLLFSATMPQPIKDLASRILFSPEFISVTKNEQTNSDIKQLYYVIEERERDAAVIRLIDAHEIEKTILFCRTKKEVERVSTLLMTQGYASKGLHGDMEQMQREQVMKSFRGGAIEILVATDVAARGLNVTDITHVINYHIPFDPESYVHRIGRTGRAGRKGTAITLVTPLEFKELQRIKKSVGTSIEHAFVPTLSDVKTTQSRRLIEKVSAQSIYDEAHIILETLQDQYDLNQVAYKLASMLIDKQNVNGPDTIGINGKRLDVLMNHLSRGDNHKNNRGRGGYRGNRDKRGGGHRTRSNSGRQRHGK